MAENLHSNHRQRWFNRFAFGVGDLSFNLVWQGTALFLMYFYTDVLGLAPEVAGAIYLAAMVWDAVTDPLIATLADRTRTRWGKYKPWLAIGVIPFAMTYLLAFLDPSEWLSVPLEVWALLTHLALRTCYTIVGVPFSAMQARITSSAHERSVIAGFRMFGAATGGMAVVTLTPLFIASYSASEEATAYFHAASCSALIALAALLFFTVVVREPTFPLGIKSERKSLFADVRSMVGMVLSNPPLMRVVTVIVLASICLSMFSKSTLYFFKYNLQRPDLSMYALLIPAVALLVMSPLWVTLSGKTSKQATLLLGTGMAFLGYVAFLLVPSEPVPVFVCIVIVAIGGSSLPIMFWSMLPDTIEFGQWRTGERAEAKTYGLATFAQKAAVGVNALLLGALLAVVGFEPNAALGEQTLAAMKLLMAGVPALGALLIVLVVWKYEIDHETHERILVAINDE